MVNGSLDSCFVWTRFLKVIGKMPCMKRTDFKRFSETATIHGLYRVGHSSGWPRRMAWGITVALLTSTVVALTTKITMTHFSYPFYTEIEKVTESSLPFPSVTVCHANNFKLSAFQEAPGVKDLITRLVNSSIKKSLDMRQIIPPSQSDLSVEFNKVYLNSTVMKSLSATPTDFKWKFTDWCTFSLTHECKYPQDFRDYFYSSSTGFCKTFNPDKTYTQIAPGVLFGLSLRLFVNESDKVPLINDNGAGVIVMVHPQDSYPNPYADAISIPLGHEAYVSMRRIQFRRLKSPFKSNCSDGKGIFQIYPGRYSVLNCQYSCFLKYIMEECAFSETAYQYHKPKEFAESMKKAAKHNLSIVEVMKCIGEIASKSGHKNTCNCPPACREDKITTKITYTQWPHPASAEYYRLLISNITDRKNMTKDDVYKSLISIRVFFDELGYQIVKESPRSSLDNLFSQIGGQMGLWIGASIFSLFETMIFLVNSIFFLFQRKVEPEKDSSTSKSVNNTTDSSMHLKEFT